MRGEEKGSGRGGREGRVVRGEEEGGWMMGGGGRNRTIRKEADGGEGRGGGGREERVERNRGRKNACAAEEKKINGKCVK
jgi:hypothetical protein